MKLAELDDYIRELLSEMISERTIKSRKPPRKMSKSQVAKRKQVGKALTKNPRAIAHFKEKHGKDWKSYAYAAATNKALKKKDK